MRTTKILSRSLPPELLREAETLAKRERRALRRYIQEQEWRSLQRYGAKRAQRLGVRGNEVDAKVWEAG